MEGTSPCSARYLLRDAGQWHTMAGMETISFIIEGLAPDDTWHLLAGPMGLEGDHQAHRDSVVRMLRKMNVTRYSKVRLKKIVTTVSIIGEDIRV